MLATMNMKWGVAAAPGGARTAEGNAFADSGEGADASRPDEDRVGLIGGAGAPLPAGGGSHRRGPSFGAPSSGGGGGGHARTDSDSAADDISPRGGGGGLGALLGGGGGPKGLVRTSRGPRDIRFRNGSM